MFRHTLLLLALPFAISSCGENDLAPTLTPADFDAVRCFEDLRFLVEDIGARRIDTKESAQTRAYIQEQLAGLGWEFRTDTFAATPPEGARRKGTVTGTNLLAYRPGTEEGSLWLCSHYDTFDRPKFVGANDAGSSTALLIELGRQLGGEGPRQGLGITLCWFDGEEPFYPIRWDDNTNSTFGSRHLSEKMKADGTLSSIKALVLMDMVGDKELGVLIESMSTGWIARIFEQTAQGLGYHQLLIGRKEVKDDHRTFLRKGVPGIDLIDFHFGPANRFWHTNKDDLSTCSVESLKKIGTLVMTALPSLEEQALKRK